MTIDETIDSEKRIQKIKELEDKVTGIKSTNPQYHKQIAEWLEELKAKRNIGECAYKQGYNKAIDDLIFKINKHKTNGYVTGITNNPFEFGACQMADDIVKLAEQLKDGVKNE